MDDKIKAIDDALTAATATLNGLVPLVTADTASIKSLGDQIATLTAGNVISADDLAALTAHAQALQVSNAAAAALLPAPAG